MGQRQAAIPSFGPLPNAAAERRLGSFAGPGHGGSLHRMPSWAHSVERVHAHVMTVATLLLALVASVGYLPHGVEIALLVVSVCLLGLPHGALDYLSGRRIFQPRFRRWWFLPFGFIYLGLAGLVVLAWTVAPTSSLVAFFVLAAAHFGLGDVPRDAALGAGTAYRNVGGAVEAAARGGLVIVALLFMHPAEVSELFSHLLPTSLPTIEATVARVSPLLAAVNGALLAVVLAHHLGGWAAGSDAHGRNAAEIIALFALFCLAPPLVAFIVYFCLWHSFRHSVRLAARLDSTGPGRALAAFVRHAWPTTLGAVGLGLASYFLLGDQTTQTAILRVVFIGLSALTVPHVVFHMLAEGPHRDDRGLSRSFMAKGPVERVNVGRPHAHGSALLPCSGLRHDQLAETPPRHEQPIDVLPRG